jgi:hypothetical protein
VRVKAAVNARALQTLREVRRPRANAPAFGLRWLQHRFRTDNEYRRPRRPCVRAERGGEGPEPKSTEPLFSIRGPSGAQDAALQVSKPRARQLDERRGLVALSKWAEPSNRDFDWVCAGGALKLL